MANSNRVVSIREIGAHEAKERVVVHILVFLVLIACCLTSSHKMSSVISFGCFLVLMLYYLLDCPELLIKYLPFLFAVATNLTGCAACEFSSFYLDELDMNAGFVGSLPLLVLSRVLFFATLIVIDKSVSSNFPRQPASEERKVRMTRWVDLISIGSLVVFLYLFAEVAAHPAFLEGMNRFAYKMVYQVGSSLRTSADYLVLFPIMSLRFGNKKLGISGLLLYAANQLWTGSKFGPMFTVICLVALTFYGKIAAVDRGTIRRVVVSGAISIFALAVFAVVLFSFTSTRNPVEYFVHRIAEQGQLWWAVYDETGGETHVEELPDEIDGMLHGSESIAMNVGANYGIYKMMYLVAPASRVNSHIGVGARYTESGYASAYYYFGTAGPLGFSLVMALLASIVTNALVWSTNSLMVVGSVLLARLLTLVRTAIGMTIFIGLLESKTLISYAVLLVLLLVEIRATRAIDRSSRGQLNRFASSRKTVQIND